MTIGSKSWLLRLGLFDVPRAASKFTQADISRALKAVQSVGFEIGSIEIRPDGVLQITRLSPVTTPPPNDPYEVWKAKRDAR